MLSDRPYMQRAPGPGYGQPSMVAILIGINVAVFVLYGFMGRLPFLPFLPLSLEHLSKGYVWQLITYQFLHANLLHIVANMLVLYFIGRFVEQILGMRSFLMLYFSGGVVGGLFQMILAWMFPEYFGGAVVGASAGVAGLVAAFATLFPERQLTLLLFFVLPINMRAKTLIWIAIAVSILGILVPRSHIAHAAHLGGIITGILYVKLFMPGRGTGGPGFREW